MSRISIQDIERDPHSFVKRIEAGEAFIVVSGEAPLAEARPVKTITTEPRPFGLCAGEFTVPADFDEPLPDGIVGEFQGTSDQTNSLVQGDGP